MGRLKVETRKFRVRGREEVERERGKKRVREVGSMKTPFFEAVRSMRVCESESVCRWKCEKKKERNSVSMFERVCVRERV